MAISKGWQGALHIGTSGVSSDTMAHINNWELSFAADALENTVFGDSIRDRTFQSGLRSHTLSFSGYSEATAVSHLDLLNLQRSGSSNTLVGFEAQYQDTCVGTAQGWQGNGVVTGLTIATPVDGLAAFSGTIQITGGLTTL